MPETKLYTFLHAGEVIVRLNSGVLDGTTAHFV